MYIIVSRLFIMYASLESCRACYAPIMHKKIHNLASVEEMLLVILFSPVKLSIKGAYWIIQ